MHLFLSSVCKVRPALGACSYKFISWYTSIITPSLRSSQPGGTVPTVCSFSGHGQMVTWMSSIFISCQCFALTVSVHNYYFLFCLRGRFHRPLCLVNVYPDVEVHQTHTKWATDKGAFLFLVRCSNAVPEMIQFVLQLLERHKNKTGRDLWKFT